MQTNLWRQAPPPLCTPCSNQVACSPPCAHPQVCSKLTPQQLETKDDGGQPNSQAKTPLELAIKLESWVPFFPIRMPAPDRISEPPALSCQKPAKSHTPSTDACGSPLGPVHRPVRDPRSISHCPAADLPRARRVACATPPPQDAAVFLMQRSSAWTQLPDTVFQRALCGVASALAELGATRLMQQLWARARRFPNRAESINQGHPPPLLP